MSANKRPSTSSLRRFITSRPYVTVAEIRRRFGLDDPDAMAHLQRNGTSAWIGLPEREATKLEELWHRDELGLQLSVEVRAPVVVGIYPMRIARYVMEGAAANGSAPTNGHAVPGAPRPFLNGNGVGAPAPASGPAYAADAAPLPHDGGPGAPHALPPAE
ncbi:MAG TPA: hypothetical protein VF114_01430 [Candidatus Limnocylindria bacterium]